MFNVTWKLVEKWEWGKKEARKEFFYKGAEREIIPLGKKKKKYKEEKNTNWFLDIIEHNTLLAQEVSLC